MNLPYFVLPMVNASEIHAESLYYGVIENGHGDRFYPDGRVERSLKRYRCDRLVGVIAHDFADILREWFVTQYGRSDSAREWQKMCDKNRAMANELHDVCASHDYFDANVAMSEAMEKNGVHVFGKNGDEEITERVSLIWDKAWTLAKEKYLS